MLDGWLLQLPEIQPQHVMRTCKVVSTLAKRIGLSGDGRLSNSRSHEGCYSQRFAPWLNYWDCCCRPITWLSSSVTHRLAKMCAPRQSFWTFREAIGNAAHLTWKLFEASVLEWLGKLWGPIPECLGSSYTPFPTNHKALTSSHSANN